MISNLLIRLADTMARAAGVIIGWSDAVLFYAIDLRMLTNPDAQCCPCEICRSWRESRGIAHPVCEHSEPERTSDDPATLEDLQAAIDDAQSRAMGTFMAASKLGDLMTWHRARTLTRAVLDPLYELYERCERKS